MFQCFQSEFLRYRFWALGFMGIHFFYWLLINTLDPNLSVMPKLMAVNPQSTMTMFIALSVGFLFGLLQMGLYKRINQWTYLIHRPLTPGKIYLGLAGAALSLLALAFLLPWTLIVAGFDVFTDTVVDFRHYLHGFYIFALAFAAYLGGSFTQLSPSKAAILATALVLFLIGHPPNVLNHAPATSAVFFIIFTITILWLGFLNFRAFKPDLSTRETSLSALLLTALPMQMAFMYLVFFLVTIIYLISLSFFEKHPHKFPPRGSELHYRQMEHRERIQFLLESLQTPAGAYLVNQVKLGDIEYSRAIPVAYPIRNQLFISDQPRSMLADEETETFWVFSHDEMLLKGTNQRTGAAVGWLGRGGFKPLAEDFMGEERFSSIPLFVGGSLLQFKQVLYQVNFTDRLLHVKHQLQGGEYYYSSLQKNADYVSISSNKNLYFFDPEAFWEEDERVEAQYAVPHPRDVKYLSHMVTLRLVDGYLISYANDYLFGGGRPGVILLRAKLNGQHEKILEREFTVHADPAFIRYQMMAASPLLNALVQEVIWPLIEPQERRHRRITLMSAKLSRPFQATLIGIGLLCALISFFAARKYQLDRATQWMWTIVNGLVGIPGLLSFYFLSVPK